MKIEKLKNGDFLKINGATYEVLYAHLPIYLHELRSKSLHPTHQLWHYSDKNEVYFVSERSKIKLKLQDIELAK